jgi:hypothetical protein
VIRHDASHVLAQAVQELFPGTQVTIGPAIEDGFYYDFARDEPFSLDDLSTIEARMAEIIDRDEKIVREVWDRNEAIAHFKGIGEAYKAEIISDLAEDEVITVYRQGSWKDLCLGPHLPSTKHVGKGFKLTKLAGAYWRGADHTGTDSNVCATTAGLRALDFLDRGGGLGVECSTSSIKIAGVAVTSEAEAEAGATSAPPNALTTESFTGATAFFARDRLGFVGADGSII